MKGFSLKRAKLKRTSLNVSGGSFVLLSISLLIGCPPPKDVKYPTGSKPSAKRKLFTKALALTTSSSESLRTFGWGAVAELSKELPPDVTEDERLRVVHVGLTSPTEASLKATVSLLSRSAETRRAILFSAQGAAPNQAGSLPVPDAGLVSDTPAATHQHDLDALSRKVALIAQARTGHATEDGWAVPFGPGLDEDEPDEEKSLLRLFRYGPTAFTKAALRRRLGQAIVDPNFERSLFAAYVAKQPAIRAAASMEPVVKRRLSEHLHALSNQSGDPLATTLAKIAGDAADALDADTAAAGAAGDPLAIRNLVSAPIPAVFEPAPLDDRILQNRPISFTLDARFRPFVLAAGVRWEDEVITSDAIDSDHIVPPSQVNVRWLSFLSGTSINPAWSVFANSNTYVGCAFGDVNETGLHDAGTPSLSALAFGIEHRIWMPANDPSQGAVSWGPGRPKFSTRLGYRPQPDSSWVAIRWRGAPSTTATGIKCTHGSTSDPIALEPGTGWAVFPVLPDTPLEFYVETSPKISQQSTRYGNTIGFTPAEDITDKFELLELDPNNVAVLPPIDLLAISQPAAPNGLLAYAAALTRESSSGQWLVPLDDAEPHDGAITALSRLRLLYELAHLDVSQVLTPADPSLPAYGPGPWQERQAILQTALPIIAYRVFKKYKDVLSVEIRAQGSFLPAVSLARSNLKNALSHLTDVTADIAQVQALLSTASTALDLPGVQSLNAAAQSLSSDTDALASALIGANHVIAELEENTAASLTAACAVARAFEWEGIQAAGHSLLQTSFPPSVGEACAGH